VSDHWHRVEALYDAMLAYPFHERAAALAAACGDEVEMQADVQSLLDQQASDARFLSAPAIAVVARLVASETSVPGIGPGSQLGPYEIERLIGEGGMGWVFRARDTRLDRGVAIKVCRQGFSSRFEHEARSIAALNHPHVCTVHDVGPDYLVMELLEGETLAALIGRGPRPVNEVLRHAVDIADGLAAAHAVGIVHRDLKPGNVMVTSTGVKVLDFGLATRAAALDEQALTSDASVVGVTTPLGQVLGTVAYMSPEQAEGTPAYARSDVFAFGVMLYEMLCGTRPFSGSTATAALKATLHDAPLPPRRMRKDIPRSLERIVMRCLEKRPDDRFPSACEVHRDLVKLLPAGAAASLRRATLIGAAIALVAGTASVGVHSYIQASRTRWVERDAVPSIARLINENRRLAAVNLYRRAASYAPGSPALVTVAEGLVANRLTVQSTPSGARVYVSDYLANAGDALTEWQFLGETPFETDRLPMWGYYRMRGVKAGFASVDRAFFPLDVQQVDLPLRAQHDVPARMVWVPAGVPTSPAPSVALPGYWIDTFEVSNREFKAFVDAGGYATEKYWTQPFVKDGRELSWTQAMEEFRDLSGRRGPARWQLGTYPDGADDMPVAGVSWYEAAAYAEFAGKQLPTVYEWYGAAGANGGISDILPASNIEGRGPMAVGAPRGMARFGSYDMAGNVKEWASNAREGRRYALGGAWNDPPYMFIRVDAEPPFTRDQTTGFRLVKRLSGASDEMLRPVTFGPYTGDQRHPPVDDHAFQIYKRLHAYDRTDLDARIERTVDLKYGRRETVTFRAAYGSERVVAHLFLPNNVAPPYQIVAFFGHAGIFGLTRIEDLQLPYEFVVRSGRALIIPAYSGSLERGPTPFILPPAQTRDRAVKWSMDLGRSIDYLQTRPDIDVDKLGYYGVSLGAAEGPRLIALDVRFKAAVLSTGGLRDADLPEIYGLNYAPRVHVPVLMMNGRDDFIYPQTTHQTPLFDALGTRAPDKVFKSYDGGHANFLTRPDVISVILNWFDKYLGPVAGDRPGPP
jgi:hypothetical protein